MTIQSKQIIKAAVAATALVVTVATTAVTLGPRAPEPTQRETPQARRFDAPPLRLAIPLLNTGVPSRQKEQVARRIWPELRNAESVRIAVKLKEAIDHLGTFEEVVVSPDASTSADFYLLARIRLSNGEDMNLSWLLMDATQTAWIPSGCDGSSRCWRREHHRLWEGWHDINDAAANDPFDPVYAKVADQIHRKLTDLKRRHERQRKKNERLIAKGHSPRLSELESAAHMRDVVFAAYFAPDIYGNAFKEQRGQLKLAYLPSQDDDDWTRIESIRTRDERFATLVSEQYGSLAEQMHRPYSDWQKDNFPLAREARLARREATWSAVAGAIGAAGAVAAAADEDNPNSEKTAAVLAAASAAAIANSVYERKKASAIHDQINEIGATVQGALRPMVVETQERTVTLTGTAQDQFLQWRALLQELYANTATDIEAVRLADDSGS